MKKTILTISMFFLFMSFPTSANAIWLLIGNYKAPNNPHDCLLTEYDCQSTIPVLREGWVLHPNIVITRFHHKGSYPANILYFDKKGEKVLKAYMSFDFPDGGGLVAYISDLPLNVEFTMVNIVDYLHEKGITIKDIYKVREFYVDVLGEFESDVETDQDNSEDTYLTWIGD